MCLFTKAESLSEFGFSDNKEGIIELLNRLNSNYDLELVNELISKLESTKFDERERATIKLSQIPLLDRKAIISKLDQLSLEQKIRLQRVLKENSNEKFIRMLAAMNQSIIKSKHKGLIKELWKSTDKVASNKYSNLWDLYRDASSITASNDDLDFIKQSILSSNPIIRYSSIQTIKKLIGKDSEIYFLKLINDDEEQIKWAISEALIEFKNPQCLLPLVDLLMCDEDFGLRWRSLEALRNITGQEFGYYAAGNAAERKVPANKWKQWVEQNMKNANLKFDDSSVNNIISLFNGNDLSTWDELPLDGFNVNAVNDGWDVKDQTILTNVGKRSALVTKRSFLNYEFNFEYKMFDRNSDSGIGIFLDQEKKNYLEIQIYPNRSGDIYRIGRAEIKLDDGNALGFSSKKFKNSNELDGQWNKMTIRVNNGQAEILINGEIQNRAFSELKKPTRILLRNEGSRVAFKNLILKNL